MRPPSGGR